MATRYVLSGSLITANGVETTVKGGESPITIESTVSCLVGDLPKMRLFQLAMQSLIIGWQASLRTKFADKAPTEEDVKGLEKVNIDGTGKAEDETKLVNSCFVAMMTDSLWTDQFLKLSDNGKEAFKILCKKAQVELEEPSQPSEAPA